MPGLSTVGQSPERWPPPCLSSPRLEQAWGWRGAGPQPLADPRTPGTAPAPSPVTAGMAHADAAGAASGALPLSPRLSACSCTQRCFGSTPPLPWPRRGQGAGGEGGRGPPFGHRRCPAAPQDRHCPAALPREVTVCPNVERASPGHVGHPDPPALGTGGGGCPAQALCPAVAGGGICGHGAQCEAGGGGCGWAPSPLGPALGAEGTGHCPASVSPPSPPPHLCFGKKKKAVRSGKRGPRFLF